MLNIRIKGAELVRDTEVLGSMVLFEAYLVTIRARKESTGS